MAININGKIYRNLQEQVAKNKEDIEKLQADSEIKEVKLGDMLITNDVNGNLLIKNQNNSFDSLTVGLGTTTENLKVIVDPKYSLTAKETETESLLTKHLTLTNDETNGYGAIYGRDEENQETRLLDFSTDGSGKNCLNIYTPLDLPFEIYSYYQGMVLNGVPESSGQAVIFKRVKLFNDGVGGDYCLQFLCFGEEPIYYNIGYESEYGIWTKISETEQINIIDNSNQEIIAETYPKATIYRHAIKLQSTQTNVVYINAMSSKNLVIDSIQDLITVFQGTSLQCTGQRDSDLLIEFFVGQDVNNCWFILKDQTHINLNSLTNISLTDNVTAINPAL